jgi:hypothetical protein
MQQPWDLRPISLRARGVHRIDNGRGLSVTALKGTVWNHPGPGRAGHHPERRPVVRHRSQRRNPVYAFRDASVLVGQPGRVTPEGHANGCKATGPPEDLTGVARCSTRSTAIRPT